MCTAVILLGNCLPLSNGITVVIQVASGVAVYGALLLLMRDGMLLELLGMAGKIMKKTFKGHNQHG